MSESDTQMVEQAFLRLCEDPPDVQIHHFSRPAAHSWSSFGIKAVGEMDALKNGGVEKPLMKMAGYCAERCAETEYDKDPSVHAVGYRFITTATMVDLYSRANRYLSGKSDVRPWDLDNYSHEYCMLVLGDDGFIEAKPDTTDRGKFALLRRMLIERGVLKGRR